MNADDVPVFDLAVYGTDVLRHSSRSHAPVEQGLRGAALLEEWCVRHGIDLSLRISSGALFSQDEAKLFVADLHLSRNGRKPGPNTVARRVDGAIRYIRWQAAKLNPVLWGSAEFEKLIGLIKAVRPRRSGPTSQREGLNEAQREELVTALRAGQAKALTGLGSLFVANRLVIYMEWSDELGIRVGELLSIRITDIDFKRLTVRIVRRPDAPDDARRNLPRVKGEGRTIPISQHLADVTRPYIDGDRARCPLASEHDFLLVAEDGSPLSVGAVGKSFRQLRRKFPKLGKGFCPHIMRYGWNEQFSEHAAQLRMTPEDEAETRRISMGWRDPASARPYLSGYRRRKLRDVSLLRQNRLFGGEAV